MNDPANDPAEQPRPDIHHLSAGPAELDALLGGGWPSGGLAEIAGRGRTSLALMAVRAVQRAQDLGDGGGGGGGGGGSGAADGAALAAWIDGTGRFCPSTAGVDLDALSFVRPGSLRRSATLASLFSADVLLRSRAFTLVVLDMPAGPCSTAGWFRLARLAERARTHLMVLHDRPRRLTGSAACLALEVDLRPASGPPWADLPPPALGVRVVRHRGDPSRQGRAAVLSSRPL